MNQMDATRANFVRRAQTVKRQPQGPVFTGVVVVRTRYWPGAESIAGAAMLCGRWIGASDPFDRLVGATDVVDAGRAVQCEALVLRKPDGSKRGRALAGLTTEPL